MRITYMVGERAFEPSTPFLGPKEEVRSLKPMFIYPFYY